MKRSGFLFFVLGVAAFAISGCSHTPGKDLPSYEEVLIYSLPYDLTYLRTMEAVESMPDWKLSETDKEKGILRVRNTNFTAFDDSDKREATFVLKRVNREQTSIALADYSRRVIGGEEIMNRIRDRVSAEEKAGAHSS